MLSPLLPHDLLLHIIDRFVQSSNDAITISHVDTSFRAATLSLSVLWSSIHIDLSKSSTLSMANLFYERTSARDSKVSLAVHGELRSTGKPRPRHSQIIAFIKACAPRLYSFEATYSGGAIVVWYLASGIHDLLSTLSYPHLRRLHIDARSWPIFRPPLSPIRLPSISSFAHLAILGLPFQYDYPPSSDHLTSLALSYVPEVPPQSNAMPRAGEGLFQIKGLQGLRTLEIHGCSREHRLTHKVPLPELRRLVVGESSGEVVGALLSLIQAPKLENVTMSFSNRLRWSSGRIPLYPNVSSFTYHPSHDYLDAYLENMEDLIQIFPAVRSLGVHCVALLDGWLARSSYSHQILHLDVLGVGEGRWRERKVMEALLDYVRWDDNPEPLHTVTFDPQWDPNAVAAGRRGVIKRLRGLFQELREVVKTVQFRASEG